MKAWVEKAKGDRAGGNILGEVKAFGELRDDGPPPLLKFESEFVPVGGGSPDESLGDLDMPKICGGGRGSVALMVAKPEVGCSGSLLFECFLEETPDDVG